jgi:hypothetical protein
MEIISFLTILHAKSREDPSKPATVVAKKECDYLDKAERESAHTLARLLHFLVQKFMLSFLCGWLVSQAIQAHGCSR